mgnify:CR=1 FL=1
MSKPSQLYTIRNGLGAAVDVIEVTDGIDPLSAYAAKTRVLGSYLRQIGYTVEVAGERYQTATEPVIEVADTQVFCANCDTEAVKEAVSVGGVRTPLCATCTEAYSWGQGSPDNPLVMLR